MKKLIVIFILFPFVLVGQTVNNSDFYLTDTIVPYFAKQKLLINDSSIINNTSLKIYKLFDSRDTIDNFLLNTEYLFNNLEICHNEFITIHIGPINFYLKQNGIFVNMSNDSMCTNKIDFKSFGCNRIVKEYKNGKIEVGYIIEKKHFKSNLGEIEVNRRQLICDDTGNNPMRLTYKSKTISFNDIGNLIFFEFDIDNDNSKELYVLNYYCCQGRLEIYKIAKK